jgi:amino acid transporter
MKNSALLPLSLAACWMLAPESLVLLGNGVGHNGLLDLPIITMAALFIALCLKLLSNETLPRGAGRNVAILEQGLGSVTAITTSICGRLPIVLLAATALLVTSGYTFNEVFVYWFPNFGFAFLLLAIILGFNLIPERYALYVQACLVSAAFIGIMILALTGLFSAGNTPPEFTNQPITFSSLSAFSMLLLFLGFETMPAGEKPISGKTIFIGFSLIILLFILWTVVSMRFVPLHRLAESTIPYATTARKIMGDPGRMIMGMVIICGSCAAVNGLFIITRRTLTALAVTKNIPGFPALTWQGRLLPVLLACAIGIMMMTGLAGHAVLEIYLRAALLLWLLHNSVLCLAASRIIGQHSKDSPISGYFCSAVLAAVCLLLMGGDMHAKELITYCMSIIAVSLMVAVGCSLLTNTNQS